MKKCTRDQKWSSSRKSVKVKVYVYIRTGYTKEKEESRIDEYIKWNGREYVEEETRESGLSVGEYVRRKDRPPVLYFSLSDCFIVISL